MTKKKKPYSKPYFLKNDGWKGGGFSRCVTDFPHISLPDGPRVEDLLSECFIGSFFPRSSIFQLFLPGIELIHNRFFSVFDPGSSFGIFAFKVGDGENGGNKNVRSLSGAHLRPLHNESKRRLLPRKMSSVLRMRYPPVSHMLHQRF